MLYDMTCYGDVSDAKGDVSDAKFSNMTIRTRFRPYCVTNYTFES